MDIIELLRIGHKSGTLTVERGEASTLEEGSIVFVEGQAVEAQVNMQRGAAAFNYLSMWQRCYFSFVSRIPPTPTPPTMTRIPPQIQDRLQPGRVAPGLSSARPGQATDAISPVRPASQPTSFHQGNNIGTLPSRLQRGEEAVQHLEDVQLPRIHRRLLLLINGQRSVSELARLITRDVDEAQRLLNDLERAGLIRQ